jgi:hypothetical protein
MGLLKRKTTTPTAPVYAECERVTAGPTSPTHIRQLTEKGRFPGGGADTPALCGAKVAWDLSVIDVTAMPSRVANQHETFRYCGTCLTELEQRLGVTF